MSHKRVPDGERNGNVSMKWEIFDSHFPGETQRKEVNGMLFKLLNPVLIKVVYIIKNEMNSSPSANFTLPGTVLWPVLLLGRPHNGNLCPSFTEPTLGTVFGSCWDAERR